MRCVKFKLKQPLHLQTPFGYSLFNSLRSTDELTEKQLDRLTLGVEGRKNIYLSHTWVDTPKVQFRDSNLQHNIDIRMPNIKAEIQF